MNRRTFFAGLVGALLPLPSMPRAPFDEEVVTGSGTGFVRHITIEGDLPGDIPLASGAGNWRFLSEAEGWIWIGPPEPNPLWIWQGRVTGEGEGSIRRHPFRQPE